MEDQSNLGDAVERSLSERKTRTPRPLQQPQPTTTLRLERLDVPINDSIKHKGTFNC